MLERQTRSKASDKANEVEIITPSRQVTKVQSSLAAKLSKLCDKKELPSKESESFFKNSMKKIDDYLGPLFCAICDDPIQNSVKIRYLVNPQDQNSKPIVACLKCHRTC